MGLRIDVERLAPPPLPHVRISSTSREQLLVVWCASRGLQCRYTERLGRVFSYLSRPGLVLEVRNLATSRYEIGDDFMFHRGTNFDL